MQKTTILFAGITIFVCGIILGYSIASSTTTTTTSSSSSELQKPSHKEIHVSTCSPPLAPSSSPQKKMIVTLEQQQQTEEGEEKEETAKKTESSKECRPFLYDLKLSFLNKIHNPNAKPSILNGGNLRWWWSDIESSSFEKRHSYFSSLRSFRQIGDSVKDDKTILHRFDQGYEAYLGHPFVRANSKELSIFEVGLGCDQYMGIGASVKLWGEYLPNARLAMLEFDEKCVETWTSKKENQDLAPKGGFVVYTGDQADPKVWKKVLEKEGDEMMYDVVIDDGGHKMEQQMQTFMQLWPRVKKGGIFVWEDLNTSWKTRYGGTKRTSASAPTTTNLIKVLMDRVHSLNYNSKKPRLADEDLKRVSPIHRVDCMHFICFVVKRFD